MKTKTARRALLTSALALLLCVTMLVGTTFAWFTDSVTSSGNIIKSGTLKVTMEWADGTKDPGAADTVWTDASTGPMFNYDKWEPGYVEVKHIKIANAGTLALKYQLLISANGVVSDLAKVIDVYYVDPATQVTDRTVLDSLPAENKLGTLDKVLADFPSTAAGELAKGTSDTITLALKMQETAGNEYQGMSIGTDFSVVLMATQLTAEKDSFDNQYDAEATYLNKDENGAWLINNMDELFFFAADVNNGNKYDNETVKLTANIDLKNYSWIPIGAGDAYFSGNFDGQGYTISNLSINAANSDNVGLFGAVKDTASVKNVTINNANVIGRAKVGALVGFAYNSITIDNCHATGNINVVGNYKVGGLVGGDYFVMTNCSVGVASATTFALRSTPASTVTVKGVHLKADLEGDCVGGVAGFVAEGAIVMSNNCANAVVEGTRKVGGVFGYVGYGRTIKECSFTGTVSTNASPEYILDNVGKISVGGIVGEIGTDNGSVTLSDNTITAVTLNGVTLATTGAIVGNDRHGKQKGEVASLNAAAAADATMQVSVFGVKLTADGDNSKITVSDKEGLLNLPKLSANWRKLFTDGNGADVPNYVNRAGADYYYSNRWTIVLDADIDLNNDTIDPIKFWVGENTGAPTFDGQGHTIKNAKIVTDATAENRAGLFNVSNEAFKNLKLDNIHVTGSNVGNSNAGILAGYCSGRIDNITITNSSVTGGKYTGGVVGSGYTNISNCSLTNVTVKGGYKLGGVIGYICAESPNVGDVTGNTLTNCTVEGIGGGVYAGGKSEYVIGKVVGNYNCNGTCNNNTVTNMTTANGVGDIGKIESGVTVTQ